MRIVVLIGVALSMLAACASAQTPNQAPQLADNRELIVLTVPPVQPLIDEVLARKYALKAVYPLEEINEVLVVLRIPEGTSIPDAISEVEAASPGVTAGAHHLYRLQADSTLDPNRTYANALIGWPEEGCPATHRIGMIDASVLPAHPGLADGRVVQKDFSGSAAVPTSDHGSRVADLLIGPGRLTDATLFSASVVDPDREFGDTAGVVSILRALDWLDSKNVDVVNVSLAGPSNKLLDRGIGKAVDGGVIVVAAAGNEGPSASPLFPAAFPFVLAITAIDSDRNVYERANRGDHIDLAAPGVDILMQTEDRLRILSGTSFAAPFVTAAIAADAEMGDRDIDSIRKRLSDRAVDLGNAGDDPVFGAGLIGTPESCIAAASSN